MLVAVSGCSPQILAQTEDVENYLDPAGHSQLVEDAEKIILDGVFGQFQAACDLAIGESLSHTADHLLLTFGENRFATRVQQSHRLRFPQSIKQVAQLRAICPHLALMHPPDALGDRRRGFSTRKNSLRSTTESLNHCATIGRVHQKYNPGLRMGSPDLAAQIKSRTPRLLQSRTHQHHIRPLLADILP